VLYGLTELGHSNLLTQLRRRRVSQSAGGGGDGGVPGGDKSNFVIIQNHSFSLRIVLPNATLLVNASRMRKFMLFPPEVPGD